MELSQLRYFCDIARTEHMTKSARSLCVAQPALTRSMHRLENELGVALFEHVGRNIRLTSEGRFFFDSIEPLLDQLDIAVKELGDFAKTQKRTIRVNALSASELVVDSISMFAVEHPEAIFEVVQNESDERCDVRVDTVASHEYEADKAIEFANTEIFQERIGIAVPLESDFTETISLADVASERFISLAGSRRFRELCDALCRRSGVTLDIGFESDNPVVVKKMIALGLGVGFWPEHTWGGLEGSGARWLPLSNDNFERAILVELTNRAQEKPIARIFYKALTGAIARACN